MGKLFGKIKANHIIIVILLLMLIRLNAISKKLDNMETTVDYLSNIETRIVAIEDLIQGISINGVPIMR